VNEAPAIEYAADGTPRLPIIDVKMFAPNVIAMLLEEFITAAWRMCFPAIVKALHPYL
jgi:hypothetical protein